MGLSLIKSTTLVANSCTFFMIFTSFLDKQSYLYKQPDIIGLHLHGNPLSRTGLNSDVAVKATWKVACVLMCSYYTYWV